MADASQGHLDLNFGHRGHVVSSRPFYFMGIGPDASISLLGGSQVARLLPDGKPDPLFGGGGYEELPRTIEGSHYVMSALSVDHRNRMVAFGSAYPPGYPSVGQEPGSVEISRGLVLRLDPDGGLDSSFGEGRGAFVSTFGLSSEERELSGEPTTRVLGGVVDSQDRPVLMAGVPAGYAPCVGHSLYSSFARAIVRLTPAGALDPSFGGGEGVSAVLRNLNVEPSPSLGLTAAGQPLVAGAAGSDCAQSSLAFRLRADGKPLRYGRRGRFHFAFKRFGRFAAFTSAGGLILRQGYPVTAKVLRVTPAGSIDRRFGADGFASVSLPGGTSRVLRPAAVDTRGRILLVGSYSRPALDIGGKRAFLVIERLLHSGKLDLRFGRNGMITTPMAAAQVLGREEAALDSHGRLLVLSQVSRRALGTRAKAVLTRFKLDG